MNPAEGPFACICVREFPAQSLLRRQPAAGQQACVVMEGVPPTEQVCSVNTRARRLGVEPGMSRVEVDAFPSASVLARSAAAEQEAEETLLQCAGKYTPRMEIFREGTALFCVLDLAGTESLWGAAGALSHALHTELRACGLYTCIAASAHFHTAALVARGAQAGPAVRVIANGAEAAALAPLPVAVLPLDPVQTELLHAWGIHTLGRLTALPDHELAARMGQAGLQLLALARAEQPHCFRPVAPRLALRESYMLDFPLESLESLLFGIALLLEQLLAQAREQLLVLAAVTVRLTLAEGHIHTCSVRAAKPGDDKQFWVRLLHLELETHPPPAAVLAVELEASPGSTSKVQLGLFSPQLPEAARLDVTLAQLNRLVGEGNAGRAVLRDTHAPESFHVEPFAVSTATAKAVPAPDVPARAAMRQLRPPEPAQVQMGAAQPVSFWFGGQRYMVEQAWGPWLTGGDWWNADAWALEQWDVAAREGSGAVLLCCMTRDRKQNCWLVTGLYD